MNVNTVKTKDYKNETLGECGKNKPNSNPIKPNFNANLSLPKGEQTQTNPISKPKENPKNPEFPPNPDNFNSKLVNLHKNLRFNGFSFLA